MLDKRLSKHLKRGGSFFEDTYANVNFSRCQLELLDLTDPSPNSVDFITLTGASIFMESNFTNVSFKQAKMRMAVFLGCKLSDTRLKQVSFKGAKVNNLYLSNTMMDTVEGSNYKTYL